MIEIRGGFMTGQIVLLIFLLCVLIFFLIYAIKEIIHNPIIIPILIIVVISFCFGGGIIDNIVISIIFEMFFMKTLEIKASRKQFIINYKVEKYNNEVKKHNEENPQNKKEELSFNEDFYNRSNDSSFSIIRIFVNCCLIIPVSVFEIGQELDLISLELSKEGRLIDKLNNYYIPKIDLCLFFFIIIFIICIIATLTNSENRILTKINKKRVANSSNINSTDNNGSPLFDDEEKKFIGNYSDEEIKILNNGKSI